jgi:hypothetical protein
VQVSGISLEQEDRAVKPSAAGMSKARRVITAITVEKRSVSEVPALTGHAVVDLHAAGALRGRRKAALRR